MAFRSYFARFPMLFMYFLATFSTGAFQNSIAPIQHIYAALFRDNAIDLNVR